MAEGEIDRLWRAYKAEPRSPVYHELVRALMNAGRHGDAVRVAEAGLEHHGNEARAYLGLGLALRGCGRIADAQAMLVRGVKLDSGDPTCVRALGEILLEQGEARRARELFAHALRKAPGDITLRELFERASAAGGFPRIPEPEPAAPARTTPLPRSRASSPRRDPSVDDTFEILEIVDATPVAPAREEVAITGHRAIPAALEVALRAELTLSTGPAASSAPARGGTPAPAARSFAAPPRAAAPKAPEPLFPAQVTVTRPESTDEISAQDIIVEADPRGPVVHTDVRSLPGRAARSERRGRVVVVVAVILGLLAGAGGVGGWVWTRARRIQAAKDAGAAAEQALARGDTEGYRTGLRLLERAAKAAPADLALRDRVALARSLAFLEAGIGKVADVEAAVKGLGETVEADAARAALRIASGEWPVADQILRKDPGAAAGETLPYLRGLLAARRGDADARTKLVEVATKFRRHVPTRLALAELELVAGAADRANGEAEHARQAQPASLRPVILSVLAQAQAQGGDPAAILALADGLAPRVAKGSACDRLLLATARSMALGRAGQAADARAAAERPGPTGCGDPMALVVWARAASAAGARASALEVINGVLRLAPAALPVRTLAATILVESGQGPEAERLLADAAGTSTEVDLLLARAALAAKDDPRAIRLLQGIVTRTPEDQEARLLLLRARVRTGDAAAASEVRALEATRRDDPGVLLAAAEVALVGRDAAGAIERLERARARAPSAEVHFRLGQAYRLTGRFGDAVDSFRAAFALSPDFADALEAAATLELARGRLDDAQAIAQQLESAPGGRGAASLLRAEIELGRGEGAAALARLDALMTPAPPPGTAPSAADLAAARRVALLRARALARTGDLDRALRAVRPYTLDGRDAEAMALHGEIRRARPTERVGAAEDFDDALLADPGLPEALLGRLEIALDRDEGGMVETLVSRAVAALQARLRPPATHARLLVIRARDAMDRGQRGLPEAVSLLSVATETAPLHAEGWYWLGKALGPREARGRAALQRFLELQSTGPLADEARRALR